MTVRVIEFKTAAGSNQTLEVNVLTPLEAGAHLTATIDLTDRRSGLRVGPEEFADALPVATAFLMATGFAERAGIPFVWVRDPRGLFPPNCRPIRDIHVSAGDPGLDC